LAGSVRTHRTCPRFEQVRTVTREGDHFTVISDKGHYRTRRVLAVGRAVHPRRLGIAGEDLEKVVYRLSGPGQYAGHRVMVVGGGDSALEAAIALAEVPGTDVTLVHRGPAFARANVANRDSVHALADQGLLTLRLSAHLTAIAPATVAIDGPEGPSISTTTPSSSARAEPCPANGSRRWAFASPHSWRSGALEQ
jgi:thioredoxin reductase